MEAGRHLLGWRPWLLGWRSWLLGSFCCSFSAVNSPRTEKVYCIQVEREAVHVQVCVHLLACFYEESMPSACFVIQLRKNSSYNLQSSKALFAMVVVNSHSEYSRSSHPGRWRHFGAGYIIVLEAIIVHSDLKQSQVQRMLCKKRVPQNLGSRNRFVQGGFFCMLASSGFPFPPIVTSSSYLSLAT